MSRQQRRAEERAKVKRESKAQFVERVHGEVEGADTIRDIWLTYFHNRFARLWQKPLEPEHIELLEEVFYAGVAGMFQIVSKASGDPEATTDADIDAGAARLQRLCEELETYARRRTGS